MAIAGLALLAGAVGGLKSWVMPYLLRPDDRLLNLPRMTVAKVDMSTVLTASGRVESSSNTIITCDLERLEVRNRGQSVSSGGASTILTLVNEGTQVEKGDVLCTLDASEYEEMAITQELKTEQAAAALKQAQLNFEVAEMAVTEFELGLYAQTTQSLEGSIVLARSDLERATDRLHWTERMLDKGFASIATKVNAERSLNQARFDLMSSCGELSKFLEYGSKKTKMELSSEVEKRRYEVIANTLRVNRNREQLANYKRMIGLCTIQAPHAGFVIYANDWSRPSNTPIEPGQTVHQSQKLFFLPDLGKMEVMTYIHESVASRVQSGMVARARIEGLANRTLEGHVVSIAPLPSSTNWFSDEVKYFVAVVKLDSVPKGMKPGMTAEVEFDVDRCLDVLAVPSEAIAFEKGHEICYVAGIDGLERRTVTLGRSNRNLLEVTGGLAEGDQVVLRPENIEVIDSLVVQPARAIEVEESPEAVSQATPGSPTAVE